MGLGAVKVSHHDVLATLSCWADAAVSPSIGFCLGDGDDDDDGDDKPLLRSAAATAGSRARVADVVVRRNANGVVEWGGTAAIMDLGAQRSAMIP
jgi:hypothetical protein